VSAEAVPSAKSADARVPRGPYRKGMKRKREILRAAFEVYSRRGYRNASIRAIADSVGLTQAGVLHHFSSKEEIFAELIRVRDELDGATSEDVVEALRMEIERNQLVEGLVHLLVMISAEAIDDGHPGHAYLQDRYAHLVGLLGTRAAARTTDGRLAGDVSPEMVARLCLAVVDGLQIQWLLDPDCVDMVDGLDAFLHTARASR
jgi:AcrR family transcriptional regulator